MLPSKASKGNSRRIILVKDGYCVHGTVRKGHGLELTLSLCDSKVKHNAGIFNGSHGLHSVLTGNQCNFHVDFAGNIYPAFPIPGSESLAAWFLPLKIHRWNLKTLNMGHSINFTLGAKRLSRSTLVKTLQNLKDNGDPLFSLDVIFDKPGTKQIVFRAVTSASKIISSLANGSNAILVRGVTDGLRRAEYDRLIREADNRRNPGFRCSTVLYIFRYLFFPALFGCFAWYLMLYDYSSPAVTTRGLRRRPLLSDSVPRLIRFGMSLEDDNTTAWYGHKVTAPGFEFELPPLPRSKLIAFQLGAIWQKLGGGEDQDEVPLLGQEKLFDEAAVLLNRPKSFIKSVNQLTAVLNNLRLEDNPSTASISQKVYGLFSTVNLIWLLSILGIAVTIGPSVYYILKPFREFLLRSWRSLLENILEPLARRCHDYGIFEIGAWVFSAWICLDGYRYYGHDAGRYIGITGGSFSMLAFLYTMGTHGGKLSKLLYSKSSDRDKMLKIFLFRFAAWAGVPLALVFQSDFLGFVAVAGVFVMLGFSGSAGSFSYCLGFKDDDSLTRCLFGAVILLAATIGLHVRDSSLVPFLEPLQTAISVFGGMVLHIFLLIISAKNVYRRGEYPSYLVRNAFMWCTLLLCHYFGDTFRMTGLKNTSSVFTVLYIWAKSAEAIDEFKLSKWLFALFTSCLLWRVSLYLHVHPGLIMSMFSTL